MKTLLVLRHAKSSWKDFTLADYQRPLNKRGKRDAPKVGHLLREDGLVPELILSSPAIRARTTAEIVAEESGYEGEIEYFPDFYPGDPQSYIEALNHLSDEYRYVMVVGHNPGLEELLETLTGDWLSLPTAALAQILFSIKSWRELDEETEGRVINLWRPRDL
jgi:phosphohistidine phosphatase